jgi:hypothetical protein
VPSWKRAGRENPYAMIPKSTAGFTE